MHISIFYFRFSRWNMKRSFTLLIITCTIYSLHAQDLYRPRDIKRAYKNQTRSNDGRPGRNYWQNTARYNITITATPPDRNIRGSEQITYINNSPDTLTRLYFKFIQNIHKPGVARLFGTSAHLLTEGIQIDSYTENGETKKWNSSGVASTVQSIRLSKPLIPRDSVRIGFDWHFQLSHERGREGVIDSTSFFLAYFYPRVAVYDDYYGWDNIAHNGALEFYNDFNDYVLHVKVPKNYIVWATGNLQNAVDVLQPTYVQRLEESMTSDRNINIVNAADLASKNVTRQEPVNTWTFAYKNITDVALGFSDHYVWNASSIIVDEKTKRRASIQAAFNDTSKDFHHMITFGKTALSYLSTKWPGTPYPFPKMTVFQGYAGMEYPMMANDETYTDTVFSRFVAMHEIGHTWFPFYMGINETRYGFMDEGWVTAFELLFHRSVMSRDAADRFFRQFRVDGWINDEDAGEDLPIITPGEHMSGNGLGNNMYGKPALAYLALKDLLGDNIFKKCLHGYIDRWNGKHPVPWDFFYSFNDISGQNLNWFWNAWFFSNNYIDLAIDNVRSTPTGQQVIISNIGGFAVPIDIEIYFNDGSMQTIHRSPQVWAAGKKQVLVDVSNKKKVQSVKLVTEVFVDADISNNTKENM